MRRVSIKNRNTEEIFPRGIQFPKTHQHLKCAEVVDNLDTDFLSSGDIVLINPTFLALRKSKFDLESVTPQTVEVIDIFIRVPEEWMK